MPRYLHEVALMVGLCPILELCKFITTMKKFLWTRMLQMSSSTNRWMLKAPPLIPMTYISLSSNIDLTEGC